MRQSLLSAVAVLVLAAFAAGQAQPAPQNQAPSAPAQPPATPQAPATNAPPPPPPHPPGLKPPPQAKTQEEYNAFTAAASAANSPDPAAAEAAARDFQAKYPNSELTSQLYMQLLFKNIQENDWDKAVEMGREVLKLDPTNPAAAIYTGEELAENTRGGDMDAAQKFDEAAKDANIGLQNVDPNLMLAANVPQAQVDAIKADLKARAYDTLGLIAFKRDDFPGAEKHFRQSIEVRGQPGDALTHLRLALTLDKQNRYNDALAEAQKAVALANPQESVAKSAQAEVERLKKLTGVPVPGAPPPAPR